MADPNTERDPLEVLAAEYMERLRQGQRPSVEDYAAQHPELDAFLVAENVAQQVAITNAIKSTFKP